MATGAGEMLTVSTGDNNGSSKNAESDRSDTEPETNLVTMQRSFKPMEYLFKRWSITILSLVLGTVILSVAAPFLVRWFLTQTEMGAIMLEAAMDSITDTIIGWLDTTGNPFAIFAIIAVFPLIAIFALIYLSWKLGVVLLMINGLPFILIFTFKRYLQNRILGKGGYKVPKNWIAKMTMILKKSFIYPVLFIIMCAAVIYTLISNALEGTVLLDLNTDGAIGLLETLSMTLQLFIGAYSLIIGFVAAFMDAKYIPPTNNPISGILDTVLDATGLSEEREEDEMEIEEVSRYYEPEYLYDSEYGDGAEDLEEIPAESRDDEYGDYDNDYDNDNEYYEGNGGIGEDAGKLRKASGYKGDAEEGDG